MKTTALKSLLSFVFAALLIAGCSLPTAPTATVTQPPAQQNVQPSGETPAYPAPTQPDYPAPSPVQEETQPSATQPGYPAPEGETPAATSETGETPSDQVINAENAAELAPVTIELPENPERILWPDPGLLPPAPEANLLLQSGANLHPVTFQPDGGASLGEPFPLPLNGNMLLAASPDASSLLVLETSQLALYSPTGEQQHVIQHPAPYAANFSQDGSFLVVTSQNELAADVYDTGSGENLAHLTGFETAAPVYNAFIAAGGQTVVYVSRATVQFQDVASGQLQPAIQFQDFVSAHAFSWDGTRLAVAAGTRLEVYAVPSGERIAETTLSQPANSLAFSPDGGVVAGGYGGGIQFWNAETLAPVATLPGPNNFTGQAAFSPDGLALVGLHENNLLSVWRVP